jgi:hypothetical protein
MTDNFVAAFTAVTAQFALGQTANRWLIANT